MLAAEFSNFYEHAMCGKWLSLLEELAPSVARVAALSTPEAWYDDERLIGTIRRECVDHIVVLGETHLFFYAFELTAGAGPIAAAGQACLFEVTVPANLSTSHCRSQCCPSHR